MIGYVYKLCCDGINEFYIGSSFNIKERKRKHKSDCNNANSKKYNIKVYQYIRANGGFDNWKFEILVEKEFENKTDLHIKEKECIVLLKPSLNSYSAYQTEEEYKLQKNAQSKIDVAKRLATKIDCACGGKTDKNNKTRHEKNKKHQKYLQTINNITNNITYNITNLNINN
jgi:hypothetical protein